MPDVYNTITTTDPIMVERVGNVLEIRAADPRQKQILESYLAEIEFPMNSQVLEVGCGTGAISRSLSTWRNVAQVIGIDPSPLLIAKARQLGAAFSNLSFQEGDAYQLTFSNEEFDAAIFHTTLCHLSNPQQALKEAFRVLKPSGWLGVFDGDYASTTLGTGNLDPLQICADSFRAFFINDSWVARRTPTLAQSAGFTVLSYRSHGYTETSRPDYMLTIVDRGADVLVSSGQIGQALADALKAEARRRVEANQFFGHITYTSLIARKPA